MAYCGRKMHFVAVAAVCGLAHFSTSTTTWQPAGERGILDIFSFAGAAAATSVPIEVNVVPKSEPPALPAVRPKVRDPALDAALYLEVEEKTSHKAETVEKKKKKKKGKKLLLRKRREVSEETDEDLDALTPSERRRRLLEKALNTFSMLATAILKFTECFGENGPFQKLTKNIKEARQVFRGEGSEDEEEEDTNTGPLNCAVGAVMEAAALFEQVEGHEHPSAMREVAPAAVDEVDTSYFVVDSEVLIEQALDLAIWLSLKVDEIKTELAVLRDERPLREDKPKTPSSVVAIRDGPTSNLPSPWIVVAPQIPAGGEGPSETAVNEARSI